MRGVYFTPDSFALTVAQAACVALPGAGLPRWAERFRAGAWALVLPLSIALVVAAIALIPTTAGLLSWVALLMVPPGAAIGLGWAAHAARPWLALPAAPMLALVWIAPQDRAGQAAATALIVLSAVALGRLLAGAAPLSALKAAVIAMAIIDAILVFSHNLQGPNAELVAATPGHGLPQLQSVQFGSAGLGYGDLFAAAVVGGILAAEQSPQFAASAAMILVTLSWKQLHLIYDVLPLTIPPAVVLIGVDVWRRRRAARDAGSRRMTPIRTTA